MLIHVLACVFTRVHIHAFTRVFTCVFICVYTRVLACVLIHAFTRVFTSPVLYVVSYGLFFGLGKLHMTSTCLVIAGYQLIMYRVFISYMSVIR